MQKLGIPAAYIVGYAGEAHAWNLLQLGGEYYCMDVTWDDPVGNPPTTYYYDYFNITDAQISKDHTRDAISAQLPVASGTLYSFNSYFGGNQYGSDFSGLDYSSTIPSGYNSTPSTSSSTVPHSSSASTPPYSEPNYSVPDYTVPSYSEPDYTIPSYSEPDYTVPSYSEPDYYYPDDDYSYIDDWSDEDWDNYWNEFDSWLFDNDNDYDNYDDWENYYFGDDWYDDDYDDWYYDDFSYDDWYYDDYCW